MEKIEKTFLEKFNKYTPGKSSHKEILSGVSRYTVKADVERRMIEAGIWLDRPVDKDTLYAIEKDIADAYGLSMVRLLPHYPPESYTPDYVHQIIREAHRIGYVTNGFFGNYNFSEDGGVITVEIGFSAGGVDLVCRAGTPEILSAILRSEFGLERQFRVIGSEDPSAEYQRYVELQRQTLQRLHDEAEQAAKASAEARRAEEVRKKEDAEKEPLLPMKQTLSAENVTFDRTPEGYIRVGCMTFDPSAPEAIYGDPFEIEPIPLRTALATPGKRVTVLGQVNQYESKESRSGDKLLMTFGITDNDASVNVKLSLPIEEGKDLEKIIKKSGRTIKRGIADVVTLYSLHVAVQGSIRPDKFDGDPVLSAAAIQKIGGVGRKDNAPEKRVELHLHTNMSTMDALTFPEFAVETAADWGWDAIAVTDHGNVQAFPLLKDSAAKKDVKVLYGMEAYYVDDAARAVYGSCETRFADDEICVFDIETTGLSVMTCKITEIGAVLIRGGEVIDRFNTFADPECPIPEEITKLTGITDEMVKGAPSQRDAVRAFLDFAGDRLLIAHNAGFDVSFIRKVCEDEKMPFPNAYLDTVALSRYLNPELKRHKLDSLADFYELGDFNHHRACDDAEMLAMIFFKMREKLLQEGVSTVPEMNAAMAESADPLKLRPYHMIILVKDMVGLKNLYKLISQSYLQYFRRFPRIPRSLLTAYRDGLIIGSACEAGELFRAILDHRTQAEIEEIASFYDYLEIQPICNNRFLIRSGKVADDEGLRELNRKIVELGEKLNIPVCATCDSHFLNKEDEIYRKILLKGQKFADGDQDVGLYLRTTEEMLEEFAYLGPEKAYEVVVTNTRAVAAKCEKILPIPDGAYTPKMDGAEEDLQKLCWDRAMEWYGYEGKIPEIVRKRLEKELSSIISNGFAVLYMIAQKLVWYSESQGYLVGSRGSVGSSFVATMAGISEVNPLPPHYRCPKCRYNEFIQDGSVGSGFDLPEKNCPHCSARMIPDGQDIPFETFLGFKGDKSPDIDLNFSGEVQGKVHKYTEELFGKENVFRAGTLGTLASKTAYGYVMKYLDEKGIALNKAEINRLVNGCVGVKRTTGQHPGGIVVIPREYDVTDFTPVQHPADDPNSDIVTTHFAFSYLHDTILKLDELGHDIPTKYKWLERYSGLSVMDVPMNDPKVYELFLSVKPLGLSEGEIDCKMGTWGLPEFGTRFVQKMLEEALPRNFADLLQISGLSHGTDVWTGNAQELIKNGTCTISEVVGTRDSIMLTLMRYGVEDSHAFKIMESVRKGKGLTPEWEEEMRAANVPDWYIWSCKKIKYMFPKAHAAAYNMSAIRLGWFKVYRPLEFYAAFFTAAPSGFDASIVTKGRRAVKNELKAIDERQKSGSASPKDVDSITYLQMVDESMARGISYLPPDLYKSGAREFLPEDREGKRIRVPFNSLPGLGDSAAEKIVQVRAEGEFLSREDLRLRAGLSKSVIQILDDAGVLDQLDDTNQISMFGAVHEKPSKGSTEEKPEMPELPVNAKTFARNTEEDLLPDGDQISLF